MRHKLSLTIALALVAMSATAAEAGSRPTGGPALAAIPAATGATEIGGTKIPIGWYDFCSRYPEECRVPQLPPADVQLSAAAWRTIVTVNARVNKAIEPITDMDQWGVAERWDYPNTGKGDCEDYVLLKRKLLIEAGLPRQALLVTVVRDKKGDGHAVLTVKTDRGDFVLDNQNPQVLSWTATGYRFIKRQSQHDPNVWVSLGGPIAPAATAAR
jgi:predicted transglutaminase-like cysteine proteinase